MYFRLALTLSVSRRSFTDGNLFLLPERPNRASNERTRRSRHRINTPKRRKTTRDVLSFAAVATAATLIRLLATQPLQLNLSPSLLHSTQTPFVERPELHYFTLVAHRCNFQVYTPQQSECLDSKSTTGRQYNKSNEYNKCPNAISSIC